MLPFFWVTGIIIDIALAFWPAVVARNKGHSFWLYFLLSIPFWWITLFIVYFGLDNKNETAQDRADAAAAEKQLEKEELAGKK
jgi:phosphotransferase system  glucose/maltose/N-acetylglucosamine-specific IIC component